MPRRDGSALRRSGDVVTQAVGDEFVVLDAAGRVHGLTGPAAAVWRAAGEGVAAQGLSDVLLTAATAELIELGLLEDRPGVSRRTVLAGGVAAGVGLLGITTLAPPALAQAISETTLTYTADGTLTIPGRTTVTFTLTGGGGGPGAFNLGFGSMPTAGGSGGAAAVLTGTIENPNGAAVTLDVFIGAGGDGVNVDENEDGGASSVSSGGNGGDAGGGGGGASGVVDSITQIVIVVAGGGGGGGNAGSPTPGAKGGDGLTTSTTTTPPSTAPGGPGGDGGGGGGGGAPGGSGGGEDQAGAGGGSFFPATASGLNISATATNAVSGPGAGGSGGTAGSDFSDITDGAAGQATFTGPGISN